MSLFDLLFLLESLKEDIRVGLVDRGPLVLLGRVDHVLGRLLVHEQVHVVAAGLVRLLELPVEDLGVVHTVTTLQGTHSHYFVDVVESLEIYLGDLIFFNEDLRASLVLLLG